MKQNRFLLKLVFLSVLFAWAVLPAAAQLTHPVESPSAEASQWYTKGKWRQGWKVKPYRQLDVETFYRQYQKNPAMYDSIFCWLKSIDPVSMQPAKNVMTWSHAVAHCQDLDLRTPENLQWEQHRQHIDLQWVVTGSERMAVTHDASVLAPKNEYNAKKDVQNFKFNKAPSADQYLVLDSQPKQFYLFFPNDVHECCGIAVKPETVRKIVVKIEYFE
ncbi:MAG: YhcH/YjgK/YiaL family protein [Bacteroidales bacterium]|nr:YhcH/YjgK/YiaL family protein [Bacteroidales bacterium]